MKDIIFIGDGIGNRTLVGKMIGLNVLGTDISKWAVEHCHPLIKDCYIQDDITDTLLNEKAELVVVYDVLEHLQYDKLEIALINLTKLGQNFIFSIPYLEDPNLETDNTHIIKEDKEWWIKQLSNHFIIKNAPTDWLFHNQILIGGIM